MYRTGHLTVKIIHIQKLPKSLQTSFLWREGSLNTGEACLLWFCVSDLHDCLWSLAAAVPDVSGRSLLHNGLLLRNEPPLLRRQTRRINCKDNCVSCGKLENPRQAGATVTVVVRQ